MLQKYVHLWVILSKSKWLSEVGIIINIIQENLETIIMIWVKKSFVKQISNEISDMIVFVRWVILR